MWRVCEEARPLSAAERARFLREQRLDPELERDVISLLMEPAASVTTSWGAPDSSYGVGGGAAVAPVRNLVGARVGRYVIHETIGRGGGGEVYSAQDTDLDRMVAVKFLHPGRMEKRWTVERFLREAKAASALNHPGIITVYEVVQSEAGLAIVMELVDGRAMRTLCSAPNPVAQVLHWGAQIADALAAAHGRGIIHRDVKPENLMLRADGFVKVLDFGLAETVSGLEHSATALLPAGTLRYMSPEQAAGARLTTATDVFSLGIVLYELLTGRHPFPADTALGALQKIAQGQAWQPPSSFVRGLPAELEQLLLRMLDREPGLRPSAQDVAVALRRLGGSNAKARPKWMMAAAMAGCCGALALGVLAWREGRTPGPITVSPVPLTDTPGVDSHPDISPDGESVVYGWGAQENSHTHLFIKRLDRDEPVKLLETDRGERVSNPRWSPDGTRVLFKSSAPGYVYALWTVARDGTDRRKLLDLRATDHSSGLSWAVNASTGGERIAYTDKSEADGNRYVVRVRDLPGGEDRIVTHPPPGVWGDWDPRLSADGQTLAFKRVTGLSNDQIFVAPAKGGGAVEVTTGRRGIGGHAWLADGRLLVAGKFAGSVYGLWSLEARAGAAPELVHRSSLDGVMPSVRGHRAAWVNRLDDHNIYAVPLAGGPPVRRIASAMYDSKPSMSPDGRIAFVSRRS
ncbi:MAG: protein kinase, partial [Bryobacterales bacterium]|nr:protein kinase [Bryobacterales bacterium]